MITHDFELPVNKVTLRLHNDGASAVLDRYCPWAERHCGSSCPFFKVAKVTELEYPHIGPENKKTDKGFVAWLDCVKPYGHQLTITEVIDDRTSGTTQGS